MEVLAKRSKPSFLLPKKRGQISHKGRKERKKLTATNALCIDTRHKEIKSQIYFRLSRGEKRAETFVLSPKIDLPIRLQSQFFSEFRDQRSIDAKGDFQSDVYRLVYGRIRERKKERVRERERERERKGVKERNT